MLEIMKKQFEHRDSAELLLAVASSEKPFLEMMKKLLANIMFEG